ncbi:MAG: ERAP1-like C-terminal domain-containing protein [Gemmatimonadaceae bacterium]|nr:ERAP1-like C-terminal domain-containing protein [Gemmatimonadaceae bacterium]
MRHLALAGALVLAAPLHGQEDSLTAPGVSLALARYRAERIGNVRYDLVMNVSEADTARGRVTIGFTRLRPGDVVVDFRGPILERVRVNGRPLEDPRFNGAHLRIPQRLVRSGENRIEVEFGAMVAAVGASIIRVRDPADRRAYLYTLLVPSDANQLFPCFDQPDLKARVTLTLTTPRDWRAVANGTRIKSDSTSRGIVHSFRETEPISTYLIAFAAGPWAEVRSKGTRKPISLYVRQSRLADVDADSIIVANDRAATWLERYFASRFPFQKLDMVLAPAFPFGGMEHPGAIFYSEERFVFRERPTVTQRLGRTSTIYHEVAHQWFGDLVTMRWFDDLWLKEGFATYMAARMQADLDPDSHAWKSFYLRNKPAAYAVDLTEGTTPVWQRLGNLDQAKSNYGAIVYNKAPSILKQLNYLVGDSAFRQGLQRFLREHAYQNATWRDLVHAIGTASGRSLAVWGDSWILRPGMPVLEQRSVVRDGRIVSFSLVQRPARALSGSRPWPIRTELLAVFERGETLRIPLNITAETTWVAELAGRPAPQFIFANAQDQAYGLVLLDPGSVATLERDIGAIDDAFLRTMLWGALWDLVREATLGPDRFLRAALRELPGESDEQLVGGLLSRIARATTAYLGDVQRAAFLPDVERVLLVGANDARRPYGVRKAHLDTYIRVAATAPAVAILDGMLDSTTIVGDTLRAPARWALVTRLVTLDAPTASARLAAETARDQTPEGARRAFVAHAARTDAATKAEYFRRYFDDRDLNEDWATASLDAFNAVEAQRLTRPFLTAALDSLPWIQRNRRIFFVGAWINGFLDGQTGDEALQLVRAFLDARPQLAPDLRSKVLQAADELERTVRIRRTFGLDAPRADPLW